MKNIAHGVNGYRILLFLINFLLCAFGILPENILRQLTRLMDETNNLPAFMQIQQYARPKKMFTRKVSRSFSHVLI